MATVIELDTRQVKRLLKGKGVHVGEFSIVPKATSYKEMCRVLRSQVYQLRYQLKKVKNGKQ